MGRLSVVSLIAGALLALAAAPAEAQTVKVGSKNFTEQYVLAEIYAAALENDGVKVERKINLGGTLIAHQALVTGEIDLYPEYTGTALVAVLKGEVSSDPQKVYGQVKDFYEKQFKVTWLKPTAINNGYVLIVRQDTADKYKLKTMSDLGKVAGELTLGAGPEFADRKDGIPGLKAVYGVDFKEFKQFAKLGLRYDALAGKQIEVANGFATDWQIAQQKLVTLEDDKHLFPPYFVAPVIRQDVLAQNPKIADILNKASALLDNKTMQVLNAKVEQDHEEAADVAHDFLKEKGVIK
ncbi:glycine/betaine ABC transporter substrate-binding protein [Aliidongia dinghuensis]|uniref:Glycine/betaine ABC transporter substrate-binding protein n=1 Tax=Aliidongia dinghuensis TaxID=1867774 RepID=A0A8J2YYS3_9PROT|nr:glycine betaine ABC transporter substrate-binding protein [Aliidongia dinghuensis]GGF42511.1 glycine/betaine ABC transporter substrate-binding protein [Aliidongia dinghuensis]